MPDPTLTLRTEPLPADVEAVRRLVASTGFFNAEEVAIAGELVEERLEKGLASEYFFCFLDVDGVLAAYTCYGPIPATERSVDLYWIAVDATHQGAGLGRRVLEATEQAIRESGRDRVYVETSGRPLYAPTRGFYERLGYHEAAFFQDFYAPGDGKVVFLRVL